MRLETAGIVTHEGINCLNRENYVIAQGLGKMLRIGGGFPSRDFTLKNSGVHASVSVSFTIYT